MMDGEGVPRLNRPEVSTNVMEWIGNWREKGGEGRANVMEDVHE